MTMFLMIIFQDLFTNLKMKLDDIIDKTTAALEK